jgi:anthranilate synthase component 1
MANGRTVSVQAGGGLVYDSVPEAEYQETVNKSRAVFTAVAQAEARVLDAVARPPSLRAAPKRRAKPAPKAKAAGARKGARR